MAELIANVLAASDGTITTLADPVASTGATTITTAGAAPSALHGGEFRVRIGNEIVTVTSGQNTTTWTVTRGSEGSTAATHSSGAKVRHVLTAGALESLLSAQSGSADDVTVEPFGSISATNVQDALEEIAAESGGSVPDADGSTNGLVRLAGDLSGTATSPQIAAGVVGATEIASALKGDAAAGTEALRALGTTSTTAAAGNDSRFPAGADIVNADISASAAIAESKLSLASDAAAGTASRRTLGTSSTSAAAGNDSRFPTSAEKSGLGAALGTLGSGNPVISLDALEAGFAVVEQEAGGDWPDRPTLHGSAIPWPLGWASQPGNIDLPGIGGTGMAPLDYYIPVPEEEA